MRFQEASECAHGLLRSREKGAPGRERVAEQQEEMGRWREEVQGALGMGPKVQC